MPAGPSITHVSLRDFRSYARLDLPLRRRLVALSGENGTGKTNLIEALSLLAPGRGLRRAELGDMARTGGLGSFTISVAVASGGGEHQLGTAFEGAPARSRFCRIDRINAASASSFGDHVRLTWLTPDLDGLFRGAAGDRRRFLDRLVLAVDAAHGARVAGLERALRSRNRLLEDQPDEVRWLEAIEEQVAELGIAVAAARRETVDRLGALIFAARDDASPFPFVTLALEGEIDRLAATLPAVDAEERYRAMLRLGRARDRAAGRTLAGPHTSDLLVRHGPKDIPAATASTGEQKALLIGLVLAHARLVTAMTGIAPLVLLDEVAAHLDPRRRAGLYEVLESLGGQVWITGADAGLFADLGGRADLLWVTAGRIEPTGS